MALVRANMSPVTRQCAGTARPPTTVPAATSVLALMVVLASVLNLAAKSLQAPWKLAGTAGASWGGGLRWWLWSPPPQPAMASRAKGASAPIRRVDAVRMGMSPERGSALRPAPAHGATYS